MAIIYTKQRNSQKILILIFFVIILIAAVVIWRNFSEGEGATHFGRSFLPREEIEINFDFLESPLLKSFQPFSEIELQPAATSSGEGGGRQNPFIPY